MLLELIAGIILLLSLTVYVLTGCADFGAGFWELLASRSKNGKSERELISHALAPIWEANHIWLIVAIVLVSGGFPRILAVLSTALHIPLLCMLIGITCRGAAFVFGHYGPEDNAFQKRWSLIFAASSAITPFFLGITLGAAVSGTIDIDPTNGVVQTNFIKEWFALFPFSVGLFTFVIGIFLSAVYLANEATESSLKDLFRKRAITCGILLGLVAWGVLVLSMTEAPIIFHGLTSHPWSWPFHTITGCLAVSCLWTLSISWMRTARALAVLQVSAIMIGLGMDLFPYLVPPHLTIFNSAAPASSLGTLLTVTCIGLTVLVPAFGYLYWIFKFRNR